jgi:hypothetical protein
MLRISQKGLTTSGGPGQRPRGPGGNARGRVAQRALGLLPGSPGTRCATASGAW